MPDRYGYFDPTKSIAWQSNGENIEHVLLTIAQRYIGDNPAHAPIYRVTRQSPVKKQWDHRYVFPLDKMYPDLRLGQKVYAWAKLWMDEEQEVPFQLNCAGPVQLYINGVKRFGSAREEEGLELAPLKLSLLLSAGWNHFVLEFTKEAHGCGGVFGTGNRKNAPYHFLAPSSDREGEEGWIFTKPLDQPLAFLPQAMLPESATDTEWFPDLKDELMTEGRVDQVFSTHPGQVVYAWGKLVYSGLETGVTTLKGYAYGPLSIMVNGELSARIDQAGAFETTLTLSRGSHDLLIRTEHGEEGCGFKMDSIDHERCSLSLPLELKGGTDRDIWLYFGPLPADAWMEPQEMTSIDKLLKSEDGGLLFWRLASLNRVARPFLENELFGRWNYPLGVTLYGLLELSKELSRHEITDYVLRHVEFATATYEYSLWDRAQFGAAGINNQLSDIDSLDDCGSFGALMILANQVRELKGAKVIADAIADYIMHRQDRMPDGALYRRIGVSESMHNTMWCDDMYMSVPFLIRYAEISGDARYIDEAAKQLLLYKKYLYMPDLKIMSHVYDVKAGEPSLTPWGRGNGWVLFALTELLTVLPKEHPDYQAILEFYRQLSEGYLRLQGSNGLWHQVLTDPESYEEASCTSMFIYSFARGIRNGWLEQPEAYADAVFAGWRGLCERAIDQQGNVYGVCRGSSWSYSNHYYKHQLTWRLNDTHGIGIVLLAGLETHRLNISLNMR